MTDITKPMPFRNWLWLRFKRQVKAFGFFVAVMSAILGLVFGLAWVCHHFWGDAGVGCFGLGLFVLVVVFLYVCINAAEWEYGRKP